ncbi:MAG: hypothetical protein JSS53_04070 [Proteobacteria bacterium]|nr:hypothetical protein [Pseudomonadota bacterium]
MPRNCGSVLVEIGGGTYRVSKQTFNLLSHILFPSINIAVTGVQSLVLAILALKGVEKVSGVQDIYFDPSSVTFWRGMSFAVGTLLINSIINYYYNRRTAKSFTKAMKEMHLRELLSILLSGDISQGVQASKLALKRIASLWYFIPGVIAAATTASMTVQAWSGSGLPEEWMDVGLTGLMLFVNCSGALTTRAIGVKDFKGDFGKIRDFIRSFQLNPRFIKSALKMYGIQFVSAMLSLLVTGILFMALGVSGIQYMLSCLPEFISGNMPDKFSQVLFSAFGVVDAEVEMTAVHLVRTWLVLVGALVSAGINEIFWMRHFWKLLETFCEYFSEARHIVFGRLEGSFWANTGRRVLKVVEVGTLVLASAVSGAGMAASAQKNLPELDIIQYYWIVFVFAAIINFRMTMFMLLDVDLLDVLHSQVTRVSGWGQTVVNGAESVVRGVGSAFNSVKAVVCCGNSNDTAETRELDQLMRQSDIEGGQGSKYGTDHSDNILSLAMDGDSKSPYELRSSH